MVIVTLLYIFLAINLFLIYMMARNNRIALYRFRVLADIDEACKFDITQKRDWHWRFEVYEAIPYNTMLLKFWRPLDSFYPEDFTNLHATANQYKEWLND